MGPEMTLEAQGRNLNQAVPLVPEHPAQNHVGSSNASKGVKVEFAQKGEAAGKEQKRNAAFLSGRELISGENPFPEDTSMPYSGFEPTRSQAECYNYHTGWGGIKSRFSGKQRGEGERESQKSGEIAADQGAAQWLSGNVSLFHAAGLGFKYRAGQSLLSLSSLKWAINVYQACLGTEHTEGFTPD
ncbi:hypothetical protein TNCV_3634121 [Trichonephila clavipes]|nr:hypothetical protein TNCV_3634121 [Trichonephila clavipes]